VKDLFKLILGVLTLLFKSRAKLAEILKAPMGVWFSCFTAISTPVSALSKGQAYCGVGGTIATT